MRKDFLEIAKHHYDRMQQNYHLNTKHSVENSKVYDETKFLDKSDGKIPQIVVEDSNVSNEIENLLVNFGDKKICVLNFASFTSPGGGFINGAMAQEEALCHDTNLYNILKEFKSLYDKNKLLRNNGIYKNWVIYSPDVVYDKMRDATKNHIDVITCPAPNASVFFNSFSSEEDMNRYSNILYERCKYVLDIARENNVNVLCLGAFGCGVFANNPYCVAECFKILLETKNYDFDVVTFPIPAGDNLDAFKEIFKDYA